MQPGLTDFMIFNFKTMYVMSQLRWCLELLCYFHLGLWFMHSLLCLFGSVWLGKKNSWHFQWTHRCSIIQRPQKANSDLNTHNNSILLELTLFYCLAKFGVGVGRCSYSYRLCRERKGVCDKLQRGIRWKKLKNTHDDNKAQIWNLFWVTEEELNFRDSGSTDV